MELSEEISEILSRSNSPKLREFALHIFQYPSNNPDYYIKEARARLDDVCYSDFFDCIIENGSCGLRAAIARARNTPEHVLARLRKDESRAVRNSAFSNPTAFSQPL